MSSRKTSTMGTRMYRLCVQPEFCKRTTSRQHVTNRFCPLYNACTLSKDIGAMWEQRTTSHALTSNDHFYVHLSKVGNGFCFILGQDIWDTHRARLISDLWQCAGDQMLFQTLNRVKFFRGIVTLLWQEPQDRELGSLKMWEKIPRRWEIIGK